MQTIKKVVAIFLLMSIISIMFLFFQVIVTQPIPIIREITENIYIQAIILGYMISFYYPLLAFIWFVGVLFIETFDV